MRSFWRNADSSRSNDEGYVTGGRGNARRRGGGRKEEQMRENNSMSGPDEEGMNCDVLK